MMDKAKEIADRVAEIIQKEMESYEDKISELKQEIEDLESSNSDLWDDVRELKNELFSRNEALPTDYLPDQQKYDLLQENWEHITLEHIEDLLKRIGR